MNEAEHSPLLLSEPKGNSSTKSALINTYYQDKPTDMNANGPTLTRRNVSPGVLGDARDLDADFASVPTGFLGYRNNGYDSNNSSSSELSTLEKQPIYKSKHLTKRQKIFYHIFNISCPLFIMILICCCVISVAIYFLSNQKVSPKQIVGQQAAVASDSEICSNMGLKILKERGGNAVDATVVIALCLGVTRPFASGIGGGGFINIFMNKTKTVDFIDAREVAPGAASQDMYANNYDESVTGGKAIAVLGEIKGLYMAHELYGKLPWKELFTDVIDMARNGWTVEPLLAIRLTQDDILKYPTLTQFTTVDANGNRRIYKEGETIKRTEYANTLEAIANQGPDAIYKGPIAEKFVKEINDLGGIITMNDLKGYIPLRPFSDPNSQVTLKDMILEFDNYKIIAPPPPSSGPVIKFILNILKHFIMKQTSTSSIATKYHYILEALKFGFGHRSSLGDVNFLPKANVTDFIINQLLNDEYASMVASEGISPGRTFSWDHYYPGHYAPLEGKGTSHFSVVDADGNAVGMTTTVNHNFGSKVASLSSGIVFNNQMNDFTVDLNKPNQFGLQPSKANVIAPGKRPQSSMSPTIFLDKNDETVRYVMGASGGPTIISALVEVFFSIEKFGSSPISGVSLPRLHAQTGSNYITMEEGFNTDIIQNLEEKGHNFEKVKILPDGHTIGCCQVVQVKLDSKGNRQLLPATDPRKLGQAAAY